MTALDKFDRLESGGLWREKPDAQRRDVTVSFGKATLVLSDSAGRPLTHWSLPAIRRENVGTRPAIFTPDIDATETLEIDDDTMVDAIEQVRKALIRSGPHPGKLRGGLSLGIGAALLGVALFWAPGAFTQKTLSVVPQSQRTEIGAIILGHYQRLTGPTCRNPRGTTALNALHKRLLGPESAGQLVVVQELPQGAAVLPGGIVMIDRRLIERRDNPAVASGYALAAVAGRDASDPLEDVLVFAGMQTTMTLFTTGQIPDETLRDYAAAILNTDQTPTQPLPLRAAFDAAQLPAQPYLDARRAASETYAVFAGMNVSADAAPLISDSDWVRLQGICAQ